MDAQAEAERKAKTKKLRAKAKPAAGKPAKGENPAAKQSLHWCAAQLGAFLSM